MLNDLIDVVIECTLGRLLWQVYQSSLAFHIFVWSCSPWNSSECTPYFEFDIHHWFFHKFYYLLHRTWTAFQKKCSKSCDLVHFMTEQYGDHSCLLTKKCGPKFVACLLRISFPTKIRLFSSFLACLEEGGSKHAALAHAQAEGEKLWVAMKSCHQGWIKVTPDLKTMVCMYVCMYVLHPSRAGDNSSSVPLPANLQLCSSIPSSDWNWLTLHTDIHLINWCKQKFFSHLYFKIPISNRKVLGSNTICHKRDTTDAGVMAQTLWTQEQY